MPRLKAKNIKRNQYIMYVGLVISKKRLDKGLIALTVTRDGQKKTYMKHEDDYVEVDWR